MARNDVLAEMESAVSQFRGRAGPERQDAIIDALTMAGFGIGAITDHLPDLMLRLGNDESFA